VLQEYFGLVSEGCDLMILRWLKAAIRLGRVRVPVNQQSGVVSNWMAEEFACKYGLTYSDAAKEVAASGYVIINRELGDMAFAFRRLRRRAPETVGSDILEERLYVPPEIAKALQPIFEQDDPKKRR
jgi:hypothetical protein